MNNQLTNNLIRVNDVDDRIDKIRPWMRKQFDSKKQTQCIITFCRGEERLKRLLCYDPDTEVIDAYEV